ncbi:RNA 2',3'-cyclic phosphodiesterase [Halomonas nitroreducens]|uniref:RNA 2',3'-cyclic phosphodiesterase n=1 Tax=Halomonas nitroreducens TaxID=447425 RepID=A0A431V5I1_9GAMM|nr:RNA 2',3'-cyclic phosphodiesterase [Halomonas nitroreducens]RTR05705.1 RNA 2',3'-cyclic phosphodiesterase [Halomonas nitroreducens]
MRLFLALVPPPALRRRLGTLADAAQARCGGRRMPDDGLHLTLAFLGEQPIERAEALAAWLARFSILPGSWRLDAWGHFRRPGIVWVGGAEGEPALRDLQRQLWDSLEEMGITGRPDRFAPHITLLRKARRSPGPELPRIAMTWDYTRVELIQSVLKQQGSHYRSLARTVLPEELP